MNYHAEMPIIPFYQFEPKSRCIWRPRSDDCRLHYLFKICAQEESFTQMGSFLEVTRDRIIVLNKIK